MNNEETTAREKENKGEAEAEVKASYKTQREDRRTSKHKGPYILGATIGEGAFAKVKVATHIHTREKVAIKILDKEKIQDDEDINRVKKEISILKRLRHKNIIQLYEVMESSRNLYIVMEYCEEKELFDYIVSKKRLDDFEACKLFQEIIDGVEYLHSQCIVHRDLKPENLLLDSKKNIKISDFGLSTQYERGSLLSTPCGTPSYAPPEMLKGEEYQGLFSDIWSCGIILYAMLCGFLPFAESKEEIICQKIMDRDYEMPDFLSDLAVDLLNNMLRIEIYERYDLEQIKAHPWFNLITPVLRPGINIGMNKIPIDENILEEVENYGFNKHKCRSNLENNKYDSMTSVYYLCLRKHIKKGGLSISDMYSEMYLRFVNDPRNRIDLSEEEILAIEQANLENVHRDNFNEEENEHKNEEEIKFERKEDEPVEVVLIENKQDLPVVEEEINYENKEDLPEDQVNLEIKLSEEVNIDNKEHQAIETFRNDNIIDQAVLQVDIKNTEAENYQGTNVEKNSHNFEKSINSKYILLPPTSEHNKKNSEEIIIEPKDQLNKYNEDKIDKFNSKPILENLQGVIIEGISNNLKEIFELEKERQIKIAPAPILIETEQETHIVKNQVKDNIQSEIKKDDYPNIVEIPDLKIEDVVKRERKGTKTNTEKLRKGPHHKSSNSTQFHFEDNLKLKGKFKEISSNIAHGPIVTKEINLFNTNLIINSSLLDNYSSNKNPAVNKKNPIKMEIKPNTTSNTNLSNFSNPVTTTDSQPSNLSKSKTLDKDKPINEVKNKPLAVDKNYNKIPIYKKKIDAEKPTQNYKKIESFSSTTTTISQATNRNSKNRIKKNHNLIDPVQNEKLDNSMSVDLNYHGNTNKRQKSKSKIKVIELIAKKLVGDIKIPILEKDKTNKTVKENLKDKAIENNKSEKVLNDSFLALDSNNVSLLDMNITKSEDKDFVIKALNQKFKSIYEQQKDVYNIKDLEKDEITLSPEIFENNINKNFINKIINHKTTGDSTSNNNLETIRTNTRTINNNNLSEKAALKKTKDMKKKAGLLAVRNNPKQTFEPIKIKKTEHRNKFMDVSAYYDPDLYMKNESSVDRSTSRHNNLRNISFSPEQLIGRANRQSSLTQSAEFARSTQLEINQISRNNRTNYTNLNNSKLGGINVIAEDDEFNNQNASIIMKDKEKKVTSNQQTISFHYQTNNNKNKEKPRQNNPNKIQERKSNFNNARDTKEIKETHVDNVANKMNDSFVKKKIKIENNPTRSFRNNLTIIVPTSPLNLHNRVFLSTKNVNNTKINTEKPIEIQKSTKNRSSSSKEKKHKINTPKKEKKIPDIVINQTSTKSKENTEKKNSDHKKHRKTPSSIIDPIQIDKIIEKKMEIPTFIHHRNQSMSTNILNDIIEDEKLNANKDQIKIKNNISTIDENEEKLFWTIKNSFYTPRPEMLSAERKELIAFTNDKRLNNVDDPEIKSKTVNIGKSDKNVSNELSCMLIKDVEKIQIHSGPVDFSYVSLYTPSEIVNKLSDYFVRNKFTFSTSSFLSLKCGKNGIHFEIEILKLEESDLYYVKFKKKKEAFYYRQMLQNILSEVKIFI